MSNGARLSVLALVAVLAAGLVTVRPARPAVAWATSGSTVAGGAFGSGPAEFNGVRGVALDSSGNVYVADSLNGRVQMWAPGATSGVTVAGGNGYGSDPNQLYAPQSVAVDGSGNVYVGDFVNNRVQMWAPGATSGVTVAGGNGYGANADQLALPQGVALDGSGNLYVADGNNHRVQKWAPGATSGTTVAGLGGYGTDASQLRQPIGVAVDSAGNVYVGDDGNARVQKWAPGAVEGTTVAGGNGNGPAANQITNAPWVAVDASGNVYVSDLYNNRVQRWAPGATSGITVAGGNGWGSAASQLGDPYGVAIDSVNNIYVADNNIQPRVQRWLGVPDAPTIGTPTPSGSTVSVAFTPGGIGGSAVTGYSATCTSSTGGTTKTGTGSASPVTVSALTPGATYTCKAKATNSAGDSDASSVSTSFTVPKLTPTVTYTGSTGLLPPGTAALTLTASVTPTPECATPSPSFTVNGTGAASSYSVTASVGVYEIEASYAGNQYCDPGSAYDIAVVGSAGDATTGGGSYKIDAAVSGNPRVNFGHTVQKQTTTDKRTANTTTTYRGQLLWTNTQAWRLKAAVSSSTVTHNGVYVSGDLSPAYVTFQCPATVGITGSNPTCGQLSGRGLLQQWDAGSSTWRTATQFGAAGLVGFTATVYDGGTTTTCKTVGGRKTCTVADVADAFGLTITGMSAADHVPLGAPVVLQKAQNGSIVVR